MKKIVLLLALSYAFLSAFTINEADIENYKRKCEAGNKDACYDLGSHYSNKLGLSTNDLETKQLKLKYFMRGCNDLREGRSCSSLGSHYGLVEKDKNKELEFYNKACDYNNSNSCRLLANIYESDANNASGKDKKELIRKSKQYNKKACNLGHKLACGDV
ncbi:hypothetical protein CCY99_06035 [Helicobacter sp. 16-1353]|uniref:tetratricopeptide repeat protein n=1 Tax=Helicobacter sp. 16-1353 TaxID=2004996 RepID=UPI000DCC19AD|nr:sel1 repeat family protein [Helicobacter sp. 16-1353]RAX53149.1 hypothetical protein CCY99_06035 [Helicobacter sp. 16-1353]